MYVKVSPNAARSRSAHHPWYLPYRKASRDFGMKVARSPTPLSGSSPMLNPWLSLGPRELYRYVQNVLPDGHTAVGSWGL